MVETVQERQSLDRILRLFDGVDCGPGGPEGNYRQRLYRVRTLIAAPVPAGVEGLKETIQVPPNPRAGASYGIAA
jgi:hypothetical protein